MRIARSQNKTASPPDQQLYTMCASVPLWTRVELQILGICLFIVQGGSLFFYSHANKGGSQLIACRRPALRMIEKRPNEHR
jgi:hypothetical protein